jgi:hypothetical protein
MSPSQARNAIKKALISIVDPHPKKRDKDAMWQHFNSSCAFCGTALVRNSRLGHGDHLVPASGGGKNHIFNRVLACSTCNGDEKLDENWITFLNRKAKEQNLNQDDARRRKCLIEMWQEKNRTQCSVANETVAAALLASEHVLMAFNQACETVRALKTQK